MYTYERDQYVKIAKCELGSHMGSKKTLAVSNIKFTPESDDQFICVSGKTIRKTSTRDLNSSVNKGCSIFLKFDIVYRSQSSEIVDIKYTNDG